LFVVLGQGDAQSEAPSEGGAPVGWIRPEEVPDRADALRGRLGAARPDTAAQAALQQIEAGIAALGPDLDALIERATAAIAHKATLAAIADVRGELEGAAAPLQGWKDELAAETKRVAEILDELAQARLIWSETRGRPETAAAGDVVARRVESSVQARDDAVARLRVLQARVLAVSDGLVDRSAAVEDVLEQLQAATVAKGTSLFVRDRAALWQRGFGTEIRSELPRVPEEILAFNRSTREYARRDARPLACRHSWRQSSWSSCAVSRRVRGSVLLARRSHRGRRGCSSARTRSPCCSSSWRRPRSTRWLLSASCRCWRCSGSSRPHASSSMRPSAPT
jgi:hypothetical protein